MPDKDYVTTDLFKISIAKLEAEDDRQNERLDKMENHMESIDKIAVSVEKLAINMEHMFKEQQSQSERLKVIEDRDGNKWRNVSSYVITTIIGLVLGYLASKLGLK